MYISKINIFPIKSCRGFSVPAADLDEYGMVGDRRMMIVDSEGTALTQRDFHSLGFVEPLMTGYTLTLRAPKMQELTVPFDDFPEQQIAVDIWNDSSVALDCGKMTAEWFSDYLQTTSRLVRMGHHFQRQIDRNYTSRDEHVGFTDGFPILMISEASLNDLNTRLEEPITMNRFRPNLTVAGSDAFAEDTWKKIRIGDSDFEVVKPCARCVVTTIDPKTGVSGPEPLRTLATYRKTQDGKVMFGQNVIHVKKSGTINVGDVITVLK